MTNTITDLDDMADGPIEPFVLEQDTEYTFSELLNLLQQHTEIILTILPAQEESLRQGLTVRKSKEKKKLKDAGVPVNNETLEFVSYKSKTVPRALDVHIKLVKPAGIKILGMKLPDDTF